MGLHKAKPGQELGGTGTIFIGGIISGEEYNSDLSGIKGLQTIDQMRKGDASIRASLLALKLPIRAANWFIEPASDDPKDIEVADFVEQNLFNEMTITWADFLRQSLLHLDYGRMVFEIVYKQLDNGKIGWHKFAPRLPSTIYKWQTDDKQDGITQLLPSGGYASIPIEKLIIFVHDKEGDNWEGISALRPAYKHWYMKEQLYKIDALSFERQGLGIPYTKPPIGAPKVDKDKAIELVKNLRANEEGHLEIPQGWEFGFLDMKGNTLRNIMPSIMHHDRQIVKNVLAQFLDLGASGGTGSFALSKDQSGLFLLSLQATARHIAEAVNKYPVPRLVDLNFEVKEYPKLNFSKIGQIDFDKLSVALQRLSQAGVLTADVELEAHVRDAMDLPEIPEDKLKEREKKEKEPTPVVSPTIVEDLKNMKENIDDKLRDVTVAVEQEKVNKIEKAKESENRIQAFVTKAKETIEKAFKGKEQIMEDKKTAQIKTLIEELKNESDS